MTFKTDDVLRARLKTTGVVEHTFSISSGEFRGVDWKIYDVGGARQQRDAWAPYFDDGKSFLVPLLTLCLLDIATVNAIIFLAPISAFDQVLAEVILALHPSVMSSLISMMQFNRTPKSIAWKIPFYYGKRSYQIDCWLVLTSYCSLIRSVHLGYPALFSHPSVAHQKCDLLQVCSQLGLGCRAADLSFI